MYGLATVSRKVSPVAIRQTPARNVKKVPAIVSVLGLTPMRTSPRAIKSRDVQKNQVVLVRRDTGEKRFIGREGLKAVVLETLEAVQKGLFARAIAYREEHTTETGDYAEMKRFLEETPGFVRTGWCGEASCEERIKEETEATIRVIPFDQPQTMGRCVACGKEGKSQVLFAKSY